MTKPIPRLLLSTLQYTKLITTAIFSTAVIIKYTAVFFNAVHKIAVNGGYSDDTAVNRNFLQKFFSWVGPIITRNTLGFVKLLVVVQYVDELSPKCPMPVKAVRKNAESFRPYPRR